MSTPSEQVEAAFNKAEGYASAAQSELATFLAAMNSAVYNAPTYSVTWDAVDEPSKVDIPDVPDELQTIGGDFKFDTSLASEKPSALTVDAPSISNLFPTLNVSAPALSFGAAPTLSLGTVPTVPSLGTITVPTAPTVDMPTVPTMLTVNTVTFGGVNLHTDMQAFLKTIPTFTLAAPTPFSHAIGPRYASDLLTNLKGLINERLAGGTGLPAAVEQAIWDRMRGREEATAEGNITEIMRTHESLGFALPSGALTSQLIAARKNKNDKLSELGREISIKQADLEQSNLLAAIQAGTALEGQLVNYAFQMEQLTFEIAKAYTDNAVQAYNAQVAGYQALLSGYDAYARAYKTLIDAAMTQVEIYKAELSGEETKANINRTLVEQYKAQIEAGMALVEIYKAELEGTKALVDLEGAKISAAGQQIQAYVAGINAQTSQVEAYKASVSAEATKVQAYEGQVRAYAAQVSAASEQARVGISYYESMVKAKADEWAAWRERVQAETARVQAVASQSSAILEGYRATLAGVQATVEQDVKHWETKIGEYSHKLQYTLSAEKLNNDAVVAAKQTQFEVGKAGAQVFSQLVSSAYSMIHTSAGVSASSGTSVGYSYSGSVADTVAALPSI